MHSHLRRLGVGSAIRAPRRWAALALGVLAIGLGSAAVATAARDSSPSLVSPRPGQRVHAGVVTLIVKDTSADAQVVYNIVYVQISPTRRLDKDHNLARCTTANIGCAYVGLRRRRGHRGEWIYKSQPSKYSFPGYWATTPRKYYWQALHPSSQPGSVKQTGRIGSFRVVK